MSDGTSGEIVVGNKRLLIGYWRLDDLEGTFRCLGSAGGACPTQCRVVEGATLNLRLGDCALAAEVTEHRRDRPGQCLTTFQVVDRIEDQ